VQRLAIAYPVDRILVVTAQQYVEAVREVLPQLPSHNVIAEPVGRNTAAAIALAAFHIVVDDPEATFAVFPADHVILKPEPLYRALELGHELALQHQVVDIGVPPSHPETGYGYIELGDKLMDHEGLAAFTVRRFVEKPDLETAQVYVNSGRYMWNSGMFIWRASLYLGALEEHLPQTFEALQRALRSPGDEPALEEAYGTIPDISVDYAVMEKVSDVVALPVDFGWHDIGDWSALYDMMEHDSNGNALEGKCVTLDVDGCLLLSPKKLIAALGIQNLIVIDTEDVLLVLPRGRSQEVKKLLEQLKESGGDGYL